MLTRRQVVLAAALVPASGPLFAQQSYTAGKEYLVVNPPAPTPRDTIEVSNSSPTPARTACSSRRTSRSGLRPPTRA